MYCGQCGTNNSEEAGYCETCGAPLLITAGARTCGACGGSLGDDDRYCPTCGTAADAEETAVTYDADDSFGEIDADDIDIDELPDWLRDMAPSDAPMSSQAGGGGQPSPDDLPDWLRESDTDLGGEQPSASESQSPAASAQMPHQPAEQFSLVSDEDLPEWLKALGDDETSSGSSGAQMQEAAPQQTAVATVFDVPRVSRAWLTQGRQTGPTQMTAAQEEFAPLEPAGPSFVPEASGPLPSSNHVPEPEPEIIDAEQRPTWFASTRVRILILALLVVIALLLAFVFIQGL